MTKYKIIEVKEEEVLDEKDLYFDIFDLINHNNKESIEEILNLTKGKINLNLAYEDGLFCALAIQRGNIEILKLLCEYDNTLINKYGLEMLVNAVMYDQIECVKYLINDKNINADELKDTDVYESFKKVELIISDQEGFDSHPSQDSTVIGDPSHNHYL